MVKLILMRHGESTANMQNTFTGWTDAPLTTKGRLQAKDAGRRLIDEAVDIDDVHTSFLKRTIITAYLICNELQINWIPIYKTWRLNERHYGALAGLNKDQAREKFGKKQVELWRRGFIDTPPKLVESDHQLVYDRIGVSIPRTESLKMTLERLMPYWENDILPKLQQGRNQLVVAHGSSLRVLVKYLEKIADDQLDAIKIPNATPIIYTFDEHFHIENKQILDY